MDLRGKVALITGGTMGIGEAIARAIFKQGGSVAITARQGGPHVDALLKEWQSAGAKAIFLSGDMSVPADCEAAVSQTVQQLGRLDVLIHNAGGPAWGKIEEISPDDWHSCMNLHVNALYYLCRAALPEMRKHKEGAILTVASSAAIRGVPGAIVYATAKGALLNFTRCLARDVADDNIRVNSIAPGVIRTRFHASMTEERKQHNLQNRIPLHREGTAEQVADACMTLITNDYITGEVLVIDGGLTSRIA